MKPKFLIPAGLHQAKLIMIVGLGIQQKKFSGETKEEDSVYLCWEFPKVLHVFNEELGEQPARIGKTYKISSHEKSNLMKLINAWRGKKMKPEEAAEFDLKNMLGKYCDMFIVHNEAASGVTYANIGNITAASSQPEGFAEPIYYDCEDHDEGAFDMLPNWIQEKITNRIMPDPTTKETAPSEETDDIPF